MIIFSLQYVLDIVRRDSIGLYVVDGLDMERLLYFCVRSDRQMKENEHRDGSEEQQIA